MPICGRADGWLSIFTTIAGRVNVDGSVFGKPVNGLTISKIVVSVTTTLSSAALSDELEDPDDPPHAASANIELATIEPNTNERFFMFISL
jgi:hypothetical protein